MKALSKLGLAAALLCAAASLIGCDEAATPSHAADVSSNSCQRNWHACKDNTDLMNNYTDLTHWRVQCLFAAKQAAKYGDPTFPSHFYFSSFHGNGDYVGDGIAVLIEPDARFQNAFGAMVHSHVECTYDIRADKVTNIEVDGN
jgi:hypothetical protein